MRVPVAVKRVVDFYQFADYGLVGDLFQVIPELTEQLR